jgi:hypothetical protein
MYSRQFGMLKAGVPEGAILNTFLPEGIEEEEGKEILEKLKAIKAKRTEERQREEEAEEAKLKKEADEEKEKELIAAERLKRMKQGGGGGSKTKFQAPSLPQGQPYIRKKTNASSVGSVGSATRASLSSAKSGASSAKAQMLSEIGSMRKTSASSTAPSSSKNDRSPSPSSTITGSTSVTAASSKREDTSIAKGKMLGDIGKMKLGSLRKTPKTPAATVIKVNTETTPQKSNVTPAYKKSIFISDEEEKKGEEGDVTMSPQRPLTVKNQVSELTDSDGESPIPPVLARVTSPDDSNAESMDMQATPMSFDTPSAWSRRPTARDIQAQIEAVEAEEEEPEHQPTDLHLGPNAFHSPGFDMAIRNSNASWDRRPSSRDIMARIKEAEQLEAKSAAIEEDKKRAAMIRARNGRDPQKRDELAIIDESERIEAATSFEVRRKVKANGDDDSQSQVSELSMTTYEDQSLDSALKGRSVPQALFLPSDQSKVPFSPALTSSPGPGFLQSGMTPDNKRQLLRLAEEGELNLPSIPDIDGTNSKDSNASKEGSSSGLKVETEEEKQRRLRAEKRAKKIEAMAAKRNAGKDDDGTAVSGISKRHRLRRKKSALNAISPEEKERTEWTKTIFQSVLNAEQTKWKTSVYSHVINAEHTRQANFEKNRAIEEMDEQAQRIIENQKQLEKRARKFALKAEKFHKLRREGGNDDESVVSAASRLRRRRTRKSTSKPVPPSVDETAVTVEETVSELQDGEQKDREQFCNGIYNAVLDADQEQWKKNVFNSALKAEEERAARLEVEAQIEAQRLAAEKEKANALRAKKMEKLQQSRDREIATGEENIAPEDLSNRKGGASPLRKMRNRRRKAALAKKTQS